MVYVGAENSREMDRGRLDKVDEPKDFQGRCDEVFADDCYFLEGLYQRVG